MLHKPYILFYYLLFSSLNIYAQNIIDFNYKLVGEKFEIDYVLDGQINNRYEVLLFTSFDDYETPVKFVSGDIGKGIMPGEDRKYVTWDIQKELGDYKGSISLKLKTRYIPFVSFNIKEGETFRRGESYLISWESESIAQNLHLELYQDDIISNRIAVVRKGNTYNWMLPKYLDPGINYKIRASNDDRFSLSKSFIIKRRFPRIIWGVPALLIAGTIAILSGSEKEQVNNKIPDPIGPD